MNIKFLAATLGVALTFTGFAYATVSIPVDKGPNSDVSIDVGITSSSMGPSPTGIGIRSKPHNGGIGGSGNIHTDGSVSGSVTYDGVSVGGSRGPSGHSINMQIERSFD